MVRYCPLCAKPDSQVEFHGELCVQCAKSRLKPFEPVNAMLCTKCGQLLDRGRNRKDCSLADEVIRLLKLKGTNATFNEAKSFVEYDTPYGRMARPVLVLFEKSMCTVCDRAGSQYFEAVIQLRGDANKVARITGMVVQKLEQKTFVPKIEELKEGIDIYCGSRNEAIAALNAFSFSYVRTEKLAGQRDGKRLYRTTLLVRL